MDNVQPLPRTPANTTYALTHCRRCQAGWTRYLADGGIITICLLAGERVRSDMTNCDRYKRRETEEEKTAD